MGEVVWEVSVDSTTARVHHHASGAPSAKSGRRKKGIGHPTDEGLRRSRGGLTSKVHLACDGTGRPLAFDHTVYARRNVVERCINRLKQWRGLATRYEKRAANYRALVVLASIVIWLDS